MKSLVFDLRLIVGYILAHALLFFSFYDKTIFWYIFTGSILVLIAFSMFQREVDDQLPFLPYLFLGILSGFLLYFVFWLGNKAIGLSHLPFTNDIHRLYKGFAPSLFWQYLALVFIAAPGEELFWRGFIQKKLMNRLRPAGSILIASILYGSVHIYSGSFLLVFAAFICGLAWGSLYFWKKSMPLAIVSHLVFDIMIFIILPLK